MHMHSVLMANKIKSNYVQEKDVVFVRKCYKHV